MSKGVVRAFRKLFEFVAKLITSGTYVRGSQVLEYLLEGGKGDLSGMFA